MKQTPNINLPILEQGDKYLKETQNEAFSVIDREIAGLNSAISSLDNAEGSIIDTKNDVETLKNETNMLKASLNDMASNVIPNIQTSLEHMKYYVTPEMFGAIGDGVTDDTQALQNTIDYCINNNHNLKSDKLTYLISSPLTLNYGDKTLCFDFGMSTITTNTELLDYYIFNLTFPANQVAQVNEICNLILDCKEKINGVELTLGQRPVFRNCYILDPKKYGFHVISGALRTDNVYLAKNNFTYQDTVAFRFESESTDNKINNVITKDFKYCIQDTGSASFYSKVHCWIKTNHQLVNSLAFDIRSGYIENCFIDTYQTGIKKSSTTGLTIVGGGMFINSRFYNEDTNTTRPLLMQGENSSDLSSIVLNGFVTNATSYNTLTNKKLRLVPDDSLYLKTENFINLTQRNIFNATDNLPYISNGESSLNITNTSRYSIVKNIIKNKNGFLYIDIIVDKIDGDFSKNYVTTVGNFKTGFVPKYIENMYITNGVIFNNSLDTKTYLPIDVYITSNGDGGTIGVRPRLDNTDITSATRLIIKLVLEANVI